MTCTSRTACRPSELSQVLWHPYLGELIASHSAGARAQLAHEIERTWRGRPRSGLRMINMSVLSWILLGLIAGLLGSKVVSRRGKGMLLNTGLGIVGAVTSGYLLNFIGPDRAARLDLYDVLVATAGAVLVLVVYHGIRRMRIQRS